MRSRLHALLLLLPLSQLVACGSSEESRADHGGGPGVEEGGPSGTDGAGDKEGGGTSSETDADDEEGPLWDGKLPSTPKLLTKNVYRFVVTDDDQLVYTTETAIEAMSVTGGSPAAVGSGAFRQVYRAGRAAIVSTDSGDSLGWSKAAGPHALAGLALTATDNVEATASASGDRALVAKISASLPPDPAKEKIWLLATGTLAVTPITAPSASALGGCVAHGETFLCVAARADDRTDVWTIDDGGASVRATIDEPLDVGLAPLDAGDAAIVRTRLGVYRVAFGSNDAPQKIGEGYAAILLQGGWLAIATPTREVEVMRPDGSGPRTVATGAGIARWATTASSGDTRRLKWIPVCDADAKDKRSNLRFVDPESDKTVVAGPACQIVAMTYSDDYALVYDNWVDTPGNQLGGYGDVVALDLRSGARPRVFEGASPTPSGTPISRSRAILSSGGSMWYYDGHTSPTTRAAPFSDPIVGVYGRSFASSGVVVATKPVNATVGDAYYVAW